MPGIDRSRERRKVAVTGATGFLGRRLVEQLWRNRHEVRVLALPQEALPESWNTEGIEVITGDVRDASGALKRLLEDRDLVFHLAALGVRAESREWDRMIEVNVVVPSRLVMIASECGVRKIVVTGTCLEYAGFGTLPHTRLEETDNPPMCGEEDLLLPSTFYGATKAAGGLILQTGAKALGISLDYLRLATLYGDEDDPQKLVPGAIRAARDGGRFAATAGEQIRDWLHIEDAVRALCAAMVCRNDNEVRVFNIGTGVGVSVRAVVEMIFNICGGSTDVIDFGSLEYRIDEPHYLILNTSRAEAELGFRAQIELRNGLAALVGPAGLTGPSSRTHSADHFYE